MRTLPTEVLTKLLPVPVDEFVFETGARILRLPPQLLAGVLSLPEAVAFAARMSECVTSAVDLVYRYGALSSPPSLSK
jgi:hypothetical protein